MKWHSSALPNQNATELAIADYGQIQGHDVTFGTGLDDLCSADGGQAAASQIVADDSGGRHHRHLVLRRGRRCDAVALGRRSRDDLPVQHVAVIDL